MSEIRTKSCTYYGWTGGEICKKIIEKICNIKLPKWFDEEWYGLKDFNKINHDKEGIPLPLKEINKTLKEENMGCMVLSSTTSEDAKYEIILYIGECNTSNIKTEDYLCKINTTSILISKMKQYIKHYRDLNKKYKIKRFGEPCICNVHELNYA